MNNQIHATNSAIKYIPIIFGTFAFLLSIYASNANALEQFHLIAKHSGKCLQQHGTTLGNGDRITQWDCVNQPNVQLEKIPKADGTFF